MPCVRVVTVEIEIDVNKHRGGPVVQKRPSDRTTVIRWFIPYGMGRTYPRDDCPDDPTRPSCSNPGYASRTHDVELLLNRFVGEELIYCYVCEEWFRPAEGYRG